MTGDNFRQVCEEMTQPHDDMTDTQLMMYALSVILCQVCDTNDFGSPYVRALWTLLQKRASVSEASRGGRIDE